MVKDFATKKTRVDGVPSTPPVLEAKPIGRWVVLGVVMFGMAGYGLWSHRQELGAWIALKLHHKAPVTTSVTPAKPPVAGVGSSAPAVQFDFYHVLANDSGKPGGTSESLVKQTQVPVTSAPSKPAASTPAPASSSSTPPSPAASSTPPTATGSSAPMAPILDETAAKPAPPKVSSPAPKSKVIAKPVEKPARAVKSATPAVYELVVASVTDKAKAQSLRAKLLLMGFEPIISTKDGRYVVHFPVTKSVAEVRALRHKLEQSGINSTVVSR